MTNTNHTPERVNWTRRIARGLGTLFAGFWVFAGVAGALTEPGPPDGEGMIVAGLIAASAVGVGVAWRYEKVGGIMVLIVGAAHSIFALFAAGRNKGFAMLISGGPFLIVGLLFLASAYRAQNRNTALA